jgi:hypothetical protein
MMISTYTTPGAIFGPRLVKGGSQLPHVYIFVGTAQRGVFRKLNTKPDFFHVRTFTGDFDSGNQTARVCHRNVSFFSAALGYLMLRLL